MASVTEVREQSGIEILDTDLEDLDEDAEAVHFRTDGPITIQVGESAGHTVKVDTAEHFIAASIESETDDITQQMTGQEFINESSVFISNEDGEVGGGIVKVDEGDIDDALDEFESEHL